MTSLIQRYQALIWQPRLDELSWPHRWLLTAIRVLAILIYDFQNGTITMRAMSLVYTTLISLVPMLALAFSLLKAFGADNAIRPTLEHLLAPLGDNSGPLIETILGFIANVKVGVLGAVGIVILFFSVLTLIQKIESGCNHIWRVRKLRPIQYRLTGYISVLVTGPLVLLAASSLTATLTHNDAVAWLTSMEPFGTALYLAGRLIPYIMYSIGFTLLYRFLPNTRVLWLPAIGGGIFAGVLWQTAGWGFAVFARNTGNVNAIYSSFAILILMLIWFYVSWMILLLGCRVAFLLQHPAWLTLENYPPRLGSHDRDRLTLLMTTLVADRFIRGQPPWTISELANRLGAAEDHLRDIIEQLVAHGLFAELNDHGTLVLPQQDIAEIRLSRILHIIRSGDQHACNPSRAGGATQAVDALLDETQQAEQTIYDGQTLRDLALSLPAESTAPGRA